MDKLLYSKFSTERAKEYAISTSIYKRIDGTKYVQKKPIYKEGEGHVHSCKKYFEHLREQYKDTNLSINKAEEKGDSVCFEFVTGSTYEEYVDSCLFKNGPESAKMAISEYFQKYINIVEEIPFQLTSRFKEVFGDYPENRETISFKVTDVDMVMSNIICGDEDVLIDYEWTFDFPIPVDYLKYRIIHYYVATSEKRNVLNNINTYVELGLEQEMIPVYENMERSFQKFIQADCIKLGDVTRVLTPGSIDLRGQILLASDFEKSTITTVYTDRGNGYTEETKKVYIMVNGWFEQEIELDSSVKSVRIDPTECCGLCKLYEFAVDDKEIIKYTTNGHQMDDMIFFKNPDPNIVFTFKKKRNHVLKVKLRYMVLDSSYYM